MTQEIINLLIEKIEDEWTLAGHPNTGEFVKSLEGKVIEEEGKTIINIWGNEYGIYMSEGVEAEKIPYVRRNRGQGRGGQSKYITGLHTWVMTKLGISDEREALGIAFAIAQRHSEEGMPYKDGRLGSGFLDKVREQYEEQIDEMVFQHLNNKIENNF